MARILLADDEAHVRQVMRHKLQSTGHDMLTASNGDEALEVARQAMPDLIVSDQQMPRMSGLELCRALFADARTAHIPVILVTSREFEIGPEETRATNVRRVISKPFSPKALVQAIENVLASNSRSTPATMPARPDAA